MPLELVLRKPLLHTGSRRVAGAARPGVVPGAGGQRTAHPRDSLFPIIVTWFLPQWVPSFLSRGGCSCRLSLCTLSRNLPACV